jgi:stearoyl-CoA desaturase (delta-9 desaturase)
MNTGVSTLEAAAQENYGITKRLPFIGVHLAALSVFFVSPSWTAVGVCFALYFLRMFGITGGYHRYFSHRSYKTGRFFQFILAALGASSAQQGPLWWAGHHRHHHQHSDTHEDIHSPAIKGLWEAHVGWLFCSKFEPTNYSRVKDLAKFPELMFAEKCHYIFPILLGVILFYSGEFLAAYHPSLMTNGAQLLVWGFFVSTVLLYHGTFCINSLAHLLGKKRFVTGDDSRNSFILSMITLGEGWHNNHHRFPSVERQGIYWWEIDITHYILKGFEKLGLIWDLVEHPKSAYAQDAVVSA